MTALAAYRPRRCRCGNAVAPLGVASVRSAARAAWRGWPRCGALCGPVMLAMVAGHSIAAMAGGSLAVWWEQRHPRAWRDPVPVTVLVATAAAVVVLDLARRA